jgi:hypothetical protein
METIAAIDLSSVIYLCDPEYRNHPFYDDIRDGIPVTWCFERSDGSRVGGMYNTHAGAARTAREFPAYFAGASIIPCVSIHAPSNWPAPSIRHYENVKIDRPFGWYEEGR